MPGASAGASGSLLRFNRSANTNAAICLISHSLYSPMSTMFSKQMSGIPGYALNHFPVGVCVTVSPTSLQSLRFTVFNGICVLIATGRFGTRFALAAAHRTPWTATCPQPPSGMPETATMAKLNVAY